MIDLYGMSSPNVRKVVIMLEELELAYTLKHLSVFRGQQLAPEHLSRNPLGKAPILVDHNHDGEAMPMFESGAILIYLAEAYGGLLPPDGMARYEVLKWLMVQVANVGPMFGQHNHFLITPSEKDGYAAGRYRAQARRLYGVLNERLAGRDWLAGDGYSIADIATFPWAGYVERHGFDWADWPNLKRWSDRIAAREAVVRAEASIQAIAPLDGAAIRDATPEELDRFFWREGAGPAADFSAIRPVARR